MKVQNIVDGWKPNKDDPEWTWLDEYPALVDDVNDYQGETVILGNDGFVLAGHHTIVAALHAGIDDIPVIAV